MLILWWSLCAFAYAHVPPSPDDTDIDYMGWSLLRGEVQYVDFIDMNWPASVWLHALSTLLFGNNLMSWRLLDSLIAAAALIAMIDLVTNTFGRAPARWLAVLYPPIYVTLGIWMAGQREAVAGHGAMVALACHVRAWQGRSWRWQAAAGIAIGAATLVKPTILFAAPLLFAHGILWSRPDRRRAFDHGAVLLASLLAVLLLGVIITLLHGAPLRAIIEGGVLLNLGHQSVSVAGRAFGTSVANLLLILLWWVTPLALAGASIAALDRRRTLAAKLLLVVPIAATLLGYQLQLKYFEYHLMPAVPVIVVLASIALAEATSRIFDRRLFLRAVGLAATLIAIGGVSVRLWNLMEPVLHYRLGLIDRTTYYGRFRPFGIDYGALLLLAERIEREVPPTGTVLVWGSENAINYLSERSQPTRFHHWVVLSYAKPPLPMAKKWNRWFEEDLTKKSPEMVVISRTAMTISRERGAESHFFLERLLANEYEKVEAIDELDIYSKKSSEVAACSP